VRNEKSWLPLVAILVSQHQQQREYLNSLAQPQIVGEAGREPELGKQIKPLAGNSASRSFTSTDYWRRKLHESCQRFWADDGLPSTIR
jgi:hypothetical protein